MSIFSRLNIPDRLVRLLGLGGVINKQPLHTTQAIRQFKQSINILGGLALA